MFAGTENAVGVSFDDGDHWQSLQLNLPHTSMRDLWVHDNDLIVATHGRGFWILDDIAPLRQLKTDTANEPAHLFTPAPVFRVRRDTNTDTPLPPDEPAGENPPDGAIIDYFLAKPASGAVTLEILDSKNSIVRRYSNDDKPEQAQSELEKGLIPLYWLRPHKSLLADAGMHRWVWDLRYPPPISTQREYPIAAVPHDTPGYPLGPTAIPGQYTVRLTANGQSYTAPLVVKMDPRVKTSTVGLRKKLDVEMHLASAITQGSQAVMQARSVQDQLDEMPEPANARTKSTVEVLKNKVSDLLDGPKDEDATKSEPALKATNSNLIALYKEVEKADVEPTIAQFDAFTKANADLATLLKGWEGMKSGYLRQLNLKLGAADLPRVDLDRPPEHEEAGENEE